MGICFYRGSLRSQKALSPGDGSVACYQKVIKTGEVSDHSEAFCFWVFYPGRECHQQFRIPPQPLLHAVGSIYFGGQGILSFLLQRLSLNQSVIYSFFSSGLILAFVLNQLTKSIPPVKRVLPILLEATLLKHLTANFVGERSNSLYEPVFTIEPEILQIHSVLTKTTNSFRVSLCGKL